MSHNGLLFDYEFCFGCYGCEVACQSEHEMELGQWGIKVQQVGPWRIQGGTGEDSWEYDYLPMLTKLCDLCAERTAKGSLPSCVHHCMAQCITYGSVEELALELAKKPYQALLVPPKA